MAYTLHESDNSNREIPALPLIQIKRERKRFGHIFCMIDIRGQAGEKFDDDSVDTEPSLALFRALNNHHVEDSQNRGCKEHFKESEPIQGFGTDSKLTQELDYDDHGHKDLGAQIQDNRATEQLRTFDPRTRSPARITEKLRRFVCSELTSSSCSRHPSCLHISAFRISE